MKWIKYPLQTAFAVAGVVLALSAISVVLLGGYLLWAIDAMALGEDWDERRPRFEKTSEIGMAIVAAIEEYSLEHGMPPPDLGALVPRYLAQIPGTGLPEYPAFEYEVKLSSAWYDLGPRGANWSRPGPVEPLDVGDGNWSEPWPTGSPRSPKNAALSLTLVGGERVVGAWLMGMPREHERIEFSAEKWCDRRSRIEMVRSLPEQVRYGETLSQVKEDLGEPEGVLVAQTPWELRVDCPNGFPNWDVFVYWPTQAYPDYLHGGSPERIGKWAYVHE